MEHFEKLRKKKKKSDSFLPEMLVTRSGAASTHQVNGPLVEGGRLQDLLHGDRLQLVRIQLLPLIRDSVVHDDGQRAHPRLLVVGTRFLEESESVDGLEPWSGRNLIGDGIQPTHLPVGVVARVDTQDAADLHVGEALLQNLHHVGNAQGSTKRDLVEHLIEKQTDGCQSARGQKAFCEAVFFFWLVDVQRRRLRTRFGCPTRRGCSCRL